MVVLITLFVIWFILPVVGELFIHYTTKPLLRVSENIEGFWDFVAGTGTLFPPTSNALALSQSIAVIYQMREKPSKGNWKQ